MFTPTNTEWTPEVKDYCEASTFYKRLLLPLQANGMACFDNNGYMENVWGAEVINTVLQFYTDCGWYTGTEALRALQVQYYTKFGNSLSGMGRFSAS